MNYLKSAIAALCLVAGTVTASTDFTADLERISTTTLSEWTGASEIVAAVREQNQRTSGLSEAEILELDNIWRAQTLSGGDMITTTLANPLSQYLAGLKSEGMGQYTEIFVTDARGLNVGQSDVTSDYWQGDEAKWQVPTATKGHHVGDVEFDESTQTYQSQVSLPILDGNTVIGVITVGINLQQLAAAN